VKITKRKYDALRVASIGVFTSFIAYALSKVVVAIAS
jgi:hypothetical protein